MLLGLKNILWRETPYRIGLARPIMDEAVYSALVESWPAEESFKEMGKGYNKLALSERCNPQHYHEFLNKSPAWREFHAYIKSSLFVEEAGLATGLLPARYTSRFEFSSMPAHGGFIAPHTDIPSKVLTLIIPMVRADTWEAAWGGGTDVLQPRDPARVLVDYQAELSAFDKVATYEYQPNQACVFLKSANSWHSVGPSCGPDGRWRRTVTVNIEKGKK